MLQSHCGAPAVPERDTPAMLEWGTPVVLEQGMPMRHRGLGQQVPGQDRMLLLVQGFVGRRPTIPLLQTPALHDCKGTEMSTQGFFWLLNPRLMVSTPRTSKTLTGSQTHSESCGRSSWLASGWTIKQQIKLNMHKCKLERKEGGIILTWWMCQLMAPEHSKAQQTRCRELPGKTARTTGKAMRYAQGCRCLWGPRTVPGTFSLPVCIQSTSQGDGKSEATWEGRLPFGLISHHSWGALGNNPPRDHLISKWANRNVMKGNEGGTTPGTSTYWGLTSWKAPWQKRAWGSWWAPS